MMLLPRSFPREKVTTNRDFGGRTGSSIGAQSGFLRRPVRWIGAPIAFGRWEEKLGRSSLFAY
jgi:hypothetical protein